MSDLALLGTSVWARLRDGRIAAASADELFVRIERGEIAVTEPLLLEMPYSARDARDFALLAAELGALPLLPLDPDASRRALDAQARPCSTTTATTS